MPYYIVKQGDCLSSIARKNGLASWKTIYKHQNNSDFIKKRPNPDLIYPGDKVFIPEKKFHEETAATDQRHRYRRLCGQTCFRMKLIDVDGTPIVGAQCRLRAELPAKDKCTDGSGMVEWVISTTEKSATVLLLDGDTSEETLGWDLKLGFLDPIDEISGIQGRLHNLAIDCGPVDGIEGPLTRAGVREFQIKSGLVVDGIAGPKTKAKLEEVHDE